jgi:ribosomal subunit interface protein
MTSQDIKITFVGMEPTEALKDYVSLKISKHSEYIEKAMSIEVTLVDQVKRKGVGHDFEAKVRVALPKGFINVLEVGNDLYACIDAAEVVLGKRFKRYFDKFKQWEGQMPWKVMEANEYIDDVEVAQGDESTSYEAYMPKVSVREKISDMRPMEEAEAIEQMELSGATQFLFRNMKTSKFSMVYRRNDGTYALVEPQDEL